MRKRFVTGFVMTFAAALWLGAGPSTPAQTGAAGPPGPTGDGLPPSLDALYPPKSAEPVYLLGKIEMADALSGLMADLMQGDAPNLHADFEAFRSRYASMARLVPEWEARYPSGPVEELGGALSSGDQARVMAAVEKIGDVCTACHAENLARVQQRFHWRRFSGIEIQDPLSGGRMPFRGFMLALSSNLAGVTLDLGQGQVENARNNGRGFAARMEALSQACTECHDTERTYYVDDSVRGMIAGLEKTLAAPEPDLEAARKQAAGIGMESCFKCHLVHMPAALAQDLSRRPE